MVVLATEDIDIERTAQLGIAELFGVRRWGQSVFVNMPLFYPSGSLVTVKLDRSAGGLVRVSDNGFAYRESESLGIQRSFHKIASSVANADDLLTGKRTIYAEVPPAHLVSAICEVAKASCQTADRLVSRTMVADDNELTEHLRERLTAVFGNNVRTEQKLAGASTSEWDVSAIVQVGGNTAVFQAVGTHPNSIYKTSTAFRDLACLDNAPTLIAVVRDKSALGPKLGLLAQEGRVIEEAQSNEVFLRAAA